MNLNKNIFFWCILIAIVAIGSFFRMYGLKNIGLFSPDEAHYFRMAKTSASIAEWTLIKFQGQQRLSPGEFMDKYGGDAIPSHQNMGFLAFASLLVFIFRYQDYALLMVSALFGVLTIIVTCLIGKYLYGKKVGILASLILAVSYAHIMYSRFGLSEMTAAFFLYLALYFYLLSIKDKEVTINKWMVFSGFFLGYSLTCHYVSSLAFGLFLILEFFNKNINWRNKRKRLFIFYGFSLIPIFIFQFITLIAKAIFLKNPELWTASTFILEHKQDIVTTYFGQFIKLLKIHLTHFGLYSKLSVFSYPFFIWYYEGYLIFTLLITGVLISIVKLFKKFSNADFIIMTFLFYMLIFLSIPQTKVARLLTVFLPVVAIIAAGTLSRIDRFMKGYFVNYKIVKYLIPVLVVTIFLQGFTGSLELLNLRSGYREAMKFLAENGTMDYIGFTDDKTLSLTEAYVDRENFQGHKRFRFESMEQAKNLYEKYSIRYVIMDQFTHSVSADDLEKIESSNPVFKTFHNTDVFLYDHAHFYKGMIEKIKNSPKELRVYDLRNIFGERAGSFLTE